MTSLEGKLFDASKTGNLDAIKDLVAIGVNIHAKYDEALRAASECGRLEVVKYLISVGADIHAQDDRAICWAAYRGHIDIVKFLVSHGANICGDKEALVWSASNGHIEVVKFLILVGANVCARKNWAVRVAIDRNYPEVVKFLISCGSWHHELNPYDYLAEIGPDHLKYFSGNTKYAEIVRVINYRASCKMDKISFSDLTFVIGSQN